MTHCSLFGTFWGTLHAHERACPLDSPDQIARNHWPFGTWGSGSSGIVVSRFCAAHQCCAARLTNRARPSRAAACQQFRANPYDRGVSGSPCRRLWVLWMCLVGRSVAFRGLLASMGYSSASLATLMGRWVDRSCGHLQFSDVVCPAFFLRNFSGSSPLDQKTKTYFLVQ